MPRRQTLALIAHDGKKADLVAFATFNRSTLDGFNLVATATTGRLLVEKVGLKVDTVLSGPLGGDAQIAGMVAEGRVQAVIFLVDPLSAHPHDPDIRTVMRVRSPPPLGGRSGRRGWRSGPRRPPGPPGTLRRSNERRQRRRLAAGNRRYPEPDAA